jgi:PPM family protein phosphatase
MFEFLKNIIRADTKLPLSTDDEETVRLDPGLVSERVEESISISPVQVLVGSGYSVGRQRDHNEDAFFSMNVILVDGNTEFPFGIFAVADGMGGHQHGELASSLASRVIASSLMSKLYEPLLRLSANGPEEPIQEILETAFSEAQEEVLKNVPGGGTTLTVALVIDEQVSFAHIGDSRAYMIHPDGNIEVITHDHSLVQRLVDLGQISQEDAEVHPQRNVLYRALGQAEPFEPDISHRAITRPGYLLLCSDGLWGLVSDEAISDIVTSASSPSLACQELVQAANDAGGPDNITALLVQFL